MLLLVNFFMFICGLFESRRTGQNINTTSSLRLQASSWSFVRHRDDFQRDHHSRR